MGFQQGFRINTNTSSLDTYRNYSASQAGMERNIERLSSGLRINKAADDAAGLSISNRMDHQVRGMQQANRNVQQGNNMLQTAEGGLNEISDILGRMRELAVQSASDTVSGEDRDSLNLEFGQLQAEIDRIAESTEYDGQTLLTGTYDGTEAATTVDKHLTLQVTAEYDSTDNTENEIIVKLGDFRTADATEFGKTVSGTGARETSANLSGVTLTLTGTPTETLDLDELGKSQATIDTLDNMINAVNDARAYIGAKQNRLEFASSNLMNSIQNNSASMSTIRDADFAAEAADLAKNQILVQSGTSMLAQANGLSQNVLALIR